MANQNAHSIDEMTMKMTAPQIATTLSKISVRCKVAYGGEARSEPEKTANWQRTVTHRFADID